MLCSTGPYRFVASKDPEIPEKTKVGIYHGPAMVKPRENIFTERKEEAQSGQTRADWHGMTDPSSLSVYTPSIFVGADRAAV